MIYDVTVLENGKARVMSMDKPYYKKFVKSLIEKDYLKTLIVYGVTPMNHICITITVGNT